MGRLDSCDQGGRDAGMGQGISSRIIAWWLRQNIWHYLWAPVLVSIILSELIVCAMSLLLLGRIDNGYLLTGLVAATLVSLAVCAVLFYLTGWLRESEQRYRSLFHNAEIGMFRSRLDGSEMLDCNKKFLEIVGKGRSEVIGSPSVAFWEDPQLREKMVAQLEACGCITDFEFGVLHPQRGVRRCIASLKLFPEHELLEGSIQDITDRKQAEALLHKSSAEVADLYNCAPCGYHSLDRDGAIVRINDTELAWLGYARDEVVGKMSWFDVLTPASRQAFRLDFPRFMQQGFVRDFEIELLRRDGSSFCGLVNATAVYDADGNYMMSRSSLFDISDRKRAEENLRITASVFGSSQEAILITDENNNIIDTNPAFTLITGYSREEVIGKNPRLLGSGHQGRAFYDTMWQALQQGKAWRGEIWNRRKSGELYAELLSISAITDDEGKVIRYVAVFSDITRIKEHEAELNRVAHYDALTGIPNRALLSDRMKQAIAQTMRDQNMTAVCYLDLDGFKPINDTFGHEAGDAVLIEIARRIGDTIRGADTVARLGGDEFAVVLLGLERGEECVATLERLLAAISLPIVVQGSNRTISASIGVSIYPLDDEDPDTLLRHADQAMYVAKQAGRNRFHIYDPALDRIAHDQHESLKSIRHALEEGQFELYYQPKVNLKTHAWVGAEALIRWQHPERGLLTPEEFLHHTDNTELDIAIGEWVTEAVLAQMHEWRSIGLDICVSINISGYHLESKGFVEKLGRQLARYPDLPPGALQIEVLETVALADLAIVRQIIESCREIGVGFALDDFGTGYSSLSYLSRLPIDALKIDQSFVRDMLEDNGDMVIVQGIVALAQAFNRQTVAEGIETEEHYRRLLDLGCDLGQGYGIARPMPANEMKNWKPDIPKTIRPGGQTTQ
jgi:diguanylate cyclase (GGDEF)-like protein/PAS domain S-box-containing protein